MKKLSHFWGTKNPFKKDLQNDEDFVQQKDSLLDDSKNSKTQKTKEALRKALEENNYDELKDILHKWTFKGVEGKKIKKDLVYLLNDYYGVNIFNKLLEWEENKMIEVEEDDDPEEWKESQNRLSFIIENILRKKTRSIQHEETQEKFFLSLIPEIVKDVASNFPPEEKRPKVIRDAIYYERKEAGKFLLEQYPLASKGIYNSINSKKFNKEIRENFITKVQQIVTELLYQDLSILFSEDEVKKESFYNEAFMIIYIKLVPILKKIIDIYRKYVRKELEDAFEKSHNKQLAEKEKLEKPIMIDQKDTEFISVLEAVQTKISPKKEKMIKKAILTFDLDLPSQKELIRKIVRLVKNQKPFKKSDYFWENGLIKVEDEGKFLDLIEDLGLEIIDEEQKVSPEVFENSQEQKEEKSEIITPLDSKDKILLHDLSLEMPREELIQKIFENLETLNYTIINPKQLKKSFEDFLTTGNNRESVLAALSNSNSMRNIILKNKGISSINLTPKCRIILRKAKNGLEVDSFHSDHDAYEDRIDEIK